MRERGDALERTGLPNRWVAPGTTIETLLASELFQRMTVDLFHHAIVAPDDQQGGGAHNASASLARSGRPPRETTAKPFIGWDGPHEWRARFEPVSVQGPGYKMAIRTE